jgi:hypothetical protein
MTCIWWALYEAWRRKTSGAYGILFGKFVVNMEMNVREMRSKGGK